MNAGRPPRRPLRVALVTDVDLAAPGGWQRASQGLSQAAFHIHRGLERLGFDVSVVGPSTWPLARRPLLRRFIALKSRWYQRRGEAYIIQAEPRLVEQASRRIGARLAALDPDVVLVLGDALPIAPNGFATDRPIVYCHDAPMIALLGFYPHPAFSRPSRESRDNFLAFEQAALRRCTLVLYACDWSATKAIEGYGLDPATVDVVPWGANLERVPSQDEVEQLIAARPATPCRLLFIGVEWHRKGGDIALATARELDRRGIPTTFTVIGCDPPSDEGPLPSFVECLGFVDKFAPEGRALLEKTLGRSHFLLLPSRAEVAGHVLAEANAFGVPSLAPAVGGIPTVVVDGVNGGLMPVDGTANDYADFIARTIAEPGAYGRLARSSAHRFATRASWDVAVRDIGDRLARVTAPAPSPAARHRRCP
jgi:glycosyltransferase involved in cell wall biosynthesis